MVAQIKKFVNEVSSELKKVSWPTREQLKESTVVVLVVTALFTLFTFLLDEVMSAAIKFIFPIG